MVFRSKYPFAQLHAVRSRNVAILAALIAKKPKLLEEQPEAGSSIVLATWSLTQKLIQIHNKPTELRTLDRRLFEEIVAELFDGFGYETELTAKTRDGGRDIIAVGNRQQIATKYLIECKRPDPGNPVGVGLVRQLLGVVEDEKATKGLLVSTTYFSPDAKAFEERNEWRLQLNDFEHIAAWITQYLEIKGET